MDKDFFQFGETNQPARNLRSVGTKEFHETNHIDLRPYIGTEGERDPLVDEVEKLRKLVQG